MKAEINAEELQRAKLLYYDMMGWSETGVPKQSALDELDISWASNKICF
jgi:aldehyde:ferredoxin oxidoreductase